MVAGLEGELVDEPAPVGQIDPEGLVEHEEGESLGPGSVEVAILVMLLVGPALLVALGVAAERGGREVVLGDGVHDRLGSEHPRLDRQVDAGELHRVAEAGGVTDQERAVHVELGLGVETADRDGLRAVADQLRAIQEIAHEGMRLELLRGEVGIVERALRFERLHHPVGDQVVPHVVEPHAAERVAELVEDHSVDHPSRLMLLGLDPPDLLDAGLEDLGPLALQVEPLDELLGETPAHALADHGDLGVDVHPRLVVALGLAVLADPHVADADPDHAIPFGEDLGAGEARVDLDSRRLAPLGQPLHHVAERDHVVAALPEVREVGGKLQRPPAREHVGHGVGAHVLGGEALLGEVGNQLGDPLRVHHRAREDVIADRPALLDDQHRRRLDQRAALCRGALIVGLHLVHQVKSGGKRRGPRTDVQDIDLHALAFDRLVHLETSTGRRTRAPG